MIQKLIFDDRGEKMDTQMVMDVMQMTLNFGSICIMFYALKKFLSKPHDTLEQRVTSLEVRVDEVEDSLKQGNDRFREQNYTNEVIINSVLALIEFEMQYCLTEHKNMSSGLEKAKDDLNRFLARRNHSENEQRGG